MRVLLAVVVMSSFTLPAVAQHDHQHSPYAGTQSETIPSLTPQEIEDLRAGEGMGFAKAAELNGFPGPKHVLDLAGQLGLSDDQFVRISKIREDMHRAAVEKGLAFLRAEQELNEYFKAGSPDADGVRRLTDRVERIRGELRAIHLNAHLDTERALSRDQVRRYNELRGY